VSDINIKPDAVELVLKRLRDTFGDFFREYYDGDPVRLDVTKLPCVIGENVSTVIQAGASTTDRMADSVRIKIVMNKKTDLGAPDGVEVEHTQKTLRRIINGRDGATGQYFSNTVASAFRVNISLGSLSVASEMTIQYGQDIRPTVDDSTDVLTAEAWVVVNFTQIIPVPVRY
jgi:hypothetical protein